MLRSALALATLALWLLPMAGSAQDLAGLGAEEERAVEALPIASEDIAQRAAAVAAELADVDTALARASDTTSRAQLEERREALRGIASLLREEAEFAERLAAEAPAPPAPPEVADPSIEALDRLYEARFEIERENEEREDTLAESREVLAAAKRKLSTAEKKRREARAALDEAAAGAEREAAQRTLDRRQFASRAAQERVYLRTLQARQARRLADRGVSDAAITDMLVQMRAALAAGGGGAELEALDRRETELRRAREASQRALATADLRIDAAQQRFAREVDPPDELLEEVEALTSKRDAIRQQVELIDAQIERVESQRSIWRNWRSLLRGEASREEMEAWKVAVAERSEALTAAEQRRRAKSDDLESRIGALLTRLRTLSDDARIRSVLEEQREVLATRLDAERAELVELAHDQRLSGRLLDDLRESTGEINTLDYAVRGLKAAREFWNYEITAVDDSAITVGSLALALMLAGLGLWISRQGSHLIGRFAMKRFRLDAGASQALETLSFYVLLVSFTLLALRAVHFPLTAFTVLGGALAIGIGFGSQNVMNNFISGLILMLERPVRARDIVEVDGNYGSVERIGARSTLIRSNDGRHIIVPNSFFLESNVVNWTLSDELIRASVRVGVIYGSPTRLVGELMERAAAEEDAVLAQPAPLVIFEDFGDNALNFDVHFWVRARSPLQVRNVQSRVRFRIDDLFREHDLVIAFPQRDVHLDSVKPIEVRVLDGAE